MQKCKTFICKELDMKRVHIFAIVVQFILTISSCEHHPTVSSGSTANTFHVVMRDTVNIEIRDTVEVICPDIVRYTSEIDELLVEKLYRKVISGDVKAYDKLYDYVSNLEHPLPIFSLSIYMAQSKGYGKAYFNCFKELILPNIDSRQIGDTITVDNETKMLALYFLTKGNNLGDERCGEVLMSSQFNSDNANWIEKEISVFYIENGCKDVELVWDDGVLGKSKAF